MNNDARRPYRWNDLSRSRNGFSAKTNPNVKPEADVKADLRANAQAEFPARTNPDYGRAPLTDEQKELASRHFTMARIMARHLHAGRRIDRDEVESIAFVALVEAARAYQATDGAQFPTFARYRIVGAILDYFRETGKRRLLPISVVSPSENHALDQNLKGTPIGISPNLPVGAVVDGADAVEFHFQKMPSAQAAACRLIYLEGKSQDEVARIMDCTRSYVSRIHREALDFLFECVQNRRGRPWTVRSRPDPSPRQTNATAPRSLAAAC